MIEGPEYINSKTLFAKVDPYDVYAYYLGFHPQPNKMYRSPFPDRRDSDPSFGLFMAKELLHKDFGDSRYKGNCVSFVCQLYNISFREALEKIAIDLKINGRVKVHNEIFHPKEKTLIQIIDRPFTTKDLTYWNNYGISVDDLKIENVYSVKELYINKQKVYIDELCFAYLFIDGEEEFLKIYQPYGKQKWLSNVPVKRAINLHQLEHKSDVVTLAKSKKDKLVLKKLITDVYECQKEGTEVISDYLDRYFDENYERKLCFFDNDEPGKRANKALNPLGYEWINIPNKYFSEGIKDPSDYVKKYGYEGLEKMLRRKDVIKDFII